MLIFTSKLQLKCCCTVLASLYMNGCVIVTSRLLGIAVGKPCFSLIYQLLCQFLCHLLSQCLKEPVFLPERKFTALIPAKPPLCRFADITAAGGAGTNDFAFRLHQNIGTFHSLVGFTSPLTMLLISPIKASLSYSPCSIFSSFSSQSAVMDGD